VLALLVLPPALSTGQEGAPATDPPGAGTVPPDPPAAPPQGGNGGGAAGGAADDAPQPAAGPEPAETASTVDLAAASQDKEKAKPAGSLTVSVGDNFYSPRSVTIDVGDTVTWSNNGAAQHSATADDGSFDTGVFGPGASRSHTFNSAGTFDYFCTVHGQAQSGTVTVASTGGGGGGGGGGGQSEAAAVASDGAAGSSTSLPSTGWNALPPMIVGVLLLLAGFALRLRDWFGPA
jgi:plastocyanin